MNIKHKIIKNSQGILNIFLSAFLFFFVFIKAHSQNDNISGEDFDENPKMHLGVKAGLGLSRINSTELINQQIRPGMAVGLYGSYFISKKIILQVELDGNLRGANFNFEQASSLERLSFFYFDVPITLQFCASKKAKIIPSLGIQPSLIFRKDAYKTQEAVPQPVVLDIKNYDFAITGGILFKMNPKIGLQLLYNYGILNINRNLAVPFYPYLGKGSPMYNRNLQLCLVF